MKSYKLVLLFRDIKRITSQLSNLEKISKSMETDVLTYKTMFEENNATMENLSEKVDVKISKLNDLLQEFDVEGKKLEIVISN